MKNCLPGCYPGLSIEPKNVARPEDAEVQREPRNAKLQQSGYKNNTSGPSNAPSKLLSCLLSLCIIFMTLIWEIFFFQIEVPSIY